MSEEYDDILETRFHQTVEAIDVLNKLQETLNTIAQTGTNSEIKRKYYLMMAKINQEYVQELKGSIGQQEGTATANEDLDTHVVC